ncbi:MAG: ABC transporter permease [Microbacterium sp.]|uniref:ABC transporter permease n=1 Tax=Microbacterium sp. TaxID=51671 RepID=UPI0039E5585C
MSSRIPVAADAPAATGPTTTRRLGLGPGTKELLALPLAFLALGMLVPIGFVLWTAAFGSGSGDVVSVVTDPLFQTALTRTLLMAALVTVFCVVLGLVYALAILLAPPGLRVLLVIGIGSAFVISLMVRTYGWIILLQPKGLLADILNSMGFLDGPLQLLQTPTAMYLGMVHVMIPYSIMLIYTALMSLDGNQLKAARSMGATGLTTFWRVVFPQISGGVVAGALLVFMISLSFYITPAFLGGPAQLTMGTLIGRELSGTQNFKSAAIMGTMLLVVVIALYFLAERIFKITERWERR